MKLVNEALLLAAPLFLIVSSFAQNVTSTNGISNNIPKYSGATSLVPSAITEVNGSVGIGTSNPGWTLDIQENMYGALRSNIQNSSPNGESLHQATNDLNHITLIGIYGSKYGPYAGINGDEGYLYAGGAKAVNIIADGSFIKFNTGTSSNGATEKMRIMANGFVGIGTQTPQSPLEVTGNITLTYLQGGSIVFQDGTMQSTAYTGTCTATGGDYAESVDVAGSKTDYEPGDVMVLSSDSKEDVTKSSEPYSSLVAGIYSTKPGYVGRRQQGNPKLASGEIPMAMIGIVPTKVSAENGPIHRGDLLVTSSIPGYAMKGTDRNRMIGAIVGKAMGSLEKGQGITEVLVTLQ